MNPVHTTSVNPSVANQDKQATVAPLVYADNLSGLALGPFVSRITFGLENPPGQFSPTLQVSMPTNALHAMAKQILDAFDSPTVKPKIDKAYETYLASFKD